MKTILVPTDYSEPAYNATIYAIQLAKELGTSVRLFHAYHMPARVPDYVAGEMDDQVLLSQEQKHMQRHIAKLEGKYGVELSGQVLMGFAADEVAVASSEYDLVVMGMQGGGMLQEILGSVSTKVMKQAKVPVLLVPQDASFAKPVNIIIACNALPDLSPENTGRLKQVLKTLGAATEILYVSKPGETGEKATGIKKDWSSILPTAGFSAEEAENTLDAIFSYTHGNNAGLLVTFPHKYGPIDKLLHQSSTKKVAFRSDIPVLVVPETHERGGTWLF